MKETLSENLEHPISERNVTVIEGFLEIHHDKGEIVFQVIHSRDIGKFGIVPLRINGLETPIPEAGTSYSFDVQVGETKWNEPTDSIEVPVKICSRHYPRSVAEANEDSECTCPDREYKCGNICATPREYEKGRCQLDIGHIGECYDS